MKQLNPAGIGLFFRRFVFFSILLSAFSQVHAQCPAPFPVADLDTTSSFVPVSTVVTRNDLTSFGSTTPLVPDTLSVTSAPIHGTAVVINDSTIIYTPAPGYTGTDFYSYTVCNACGTCAQGNVTIYVRYSCPAPVPVADVYTIYNDRANTLHVTANDINVTGGLLTVSLRRQPSHGTATLSGTDVVYQGNGTYTGADTLSYVVCDSCPNHNCDTGYVYLNLIVCAKPQANTDHSTLNQGASTSVDVTANDGGITGFGTVAVTLLSTSRLGGSATLSGHTVTYTASTTRFGIDTIIYQVCTDCGCDTGYAIYTVQQVPCSKPTATIDNLYAGYSATCSETYTITDNDIIPINSGNLTVTLVSGPIFGTASIVNNKLVYTCTDPSRVGQIDQLRYSLCNACLCDTGSIAMHITNNSCNGLNPFVNKDTTSVCRNYPVSINVIANDVDPEGTTVTLDTIVGAAQHGSAIKTSSTNIEYVPANGFTGHDFIVYQACDNGTPKLCNIATVDVYVHDCNSAPVILNAANNPTDTLHISVYEDSFTNYCFHYTQADSPYVYISYIGRGIDTITPSAGSTTLGLNPCVRIAPPFQSRASDTALVIICNPYPLCDTVQLVISVIPINHHPRAYPDAISPPLGDTTFTCVNVLRNDQDDDIGDHLTITSFDSVTAHHGTVQYSADSSLCYLPFANYVGADTFYYTICDTSRACSTSYVTVNIPLRVYNYNYYDTVGQGETISITVASQSNAQNPYTTLCGQPLHGTASIDSNDHIVYVSNSDYPVTTVNPDDTTATLGLDSFCYTICNVTGTDTTCVNAEVVMTVVGKNTFFIPQGISPNGDGVNDKFVITQVAQFPKSQLLVYNRYGDEVWRNDSDGYNNDFDGTWKKNGQPLPDMSYWYIFKFNDSIHADRMGYIVIER